MSRAWCHVAPHDDELGTTTPCMSQQIHPDVKCAHAHNPMQYAANILQKGRADAQSAMPSWYSLKQSHSTQFLSTPRPNPQPITK